MRNRAALDMEDRYNNAQKVARLKATLEKLTGKMVCFRDRAKYNASQARLQRNKRKASKK